MPCLFFSQVRSGGGMDKGSGVRPNGRRVRFGGVSAKDAVFQTAMGAAMAGCGS